MNNHALTQARPVMQFGELLKADSEKDAVSIAGHLPEIFPNIRLVIVLSCKLDAPAPCRLDAPDFSFVC